MRFTNAIAVALAATGVIGSNWFSKAAYNKWHETELERWLSDHDVPYPTPADRKDLEKLLETHWNDVVVSPYKSWSEADLTSYLKAKGVETKENAEAGKDALLAQVQGSWYETEDKAQQAWISTKDWMFDTWSDSQIKAFCDYHGIPVPQPRHRDTLLQKARAGYDASAKKLGEAAAYPGNWLYQSWTESDLKEWLDTNGFPAPQPTNRDKLIASVRRNSRLAYLKMQDQSAATSAGAKATWTAVTDKLIDSWSETELKDLLDKNGVPVPQGTKLNELRALVRKRRAEVMDDTVAASAASAFGAATTRAGNEFAKATDSAQLMLEEAFNSAVDSWSETRLKAYLDARGVPVPHASKADELRALVRKHSRNAASGWSVWSWDDMSYDSLKKYLSTQGDATAQKLSKQSDATREDLVQAANSVYSSASSVGGTSYASMTSYLSQATEEARKSSFDTWSESDVKKYLDSYGIPVPQGSTANELRAYARKQHTYFKFGTSSPTGSLFARVEDGIKGAFDWAAKQLHMGADAADKHVAEAEHQLSKAKADAAATAKAKTAKAKDEL